MTSFNFEGLQLDWANILMFYHVCFVSLHILFSILINSSSIVTFAQIAFLNILFIVNCIWQLSKL